MSRRIISVFFVIICLFGFLFFRLSSLIQAEELTQVAQTHGTYSLKIPQRRGEIYDCNFKSFVNADTTYLAAVAPTLQSYQALENHVQSRDELLELLEAGKPFLIQVDTLDIVCKGVQVFPVQERYADEADGGLAAHIIGYLNGDGEGVSGVEQAYGDFLKKNGSTVTVRYAVNAAGQMLGEDSIEIQRQGEDNHRGVVLTLDRNIQQIVQNAAKGRIDSGAVLVMDVNTGDIKASASYPTFSQKDVASALNREDSPLFNRAMGAYNVGSTFKLCTTAAALESGISPNLGYTCTGEIDVDGQIFHCHRRQGHGYMDLKHATESSCNPFFIHLSLLLGGSPISSMASRMGFGRETVLLPDVLTSAAGSLPSGSELRNPAAVANFGFGQGTLMATPVQIAQMISSIANGGNAVTPRLVQGISDEQGQALAQDQPQVQPARIFSEDTAKVIRENMIAVVEEGSGKQAKPIQGGAGGKTASAQTGTYREDGTEIVQAWFAGFYPASEPKYAIVVLNEGMESGGDYAAPIFKKICDGLYRMGY